MAQTHVAHVPPRVDGIELNRVVTWLGEQGIGDGGITAATRIAGGTQDTLVRMRLGVDEVMLRCAPLDQRDGSDTPLMREARVLGALGGTEVAHPRLLAVCDDVTVAGSAFSVMESVSGFNPTTELPGEFATSPPAQHYMGLAMVDGLVSLARVDVDRVGLRDLAHHDDWIARQTTRWSRLLDSYRHFAGYDAGRLAATDHIRAWIERHAPTSWTPGLVHGDYCFDNVLFAPHAPELAAILDWGLAGIGDPLLDLGHLVVTWPSFEPDAVNDVPKAPGLPSRAEIVGRYAWLSGRSLVDLSWYCVLACYRSAVLLEGGYARSRAGLIAPAAGDSLGVMASRWVSRAGDMLRNPAKILG